MSDIQAMALNETTLRLAAAQAENERLRAALKVAAVSGYCAISRKVACPVCGRHPDETHVPLCAIGDVLASPSDTSALEALRADDAKRLDAVRAQERERCAKVCDDMSGWRDWADLKHPNFPGAPCEAGSAADWLADKIRALKSEPQEGAKG